MSIEVLEAASDSPKVIRVDDIKKVKVKQESRKIGYVDALGEFTLPRVGRKSFRLIAWPISTPHLSVLRLDPYEDDGRVYEFDLKKRACIDDWNLKIPSDTAKHAPGLSIDASELELGNIEVDKDGDMNMEEEDRDRSMVYFQGELLDPTTWKIDYVDNDIHERPDFYRDVHATWGVNGKYEWDEEVGPEEIK